MASTVFERISSQDESLVAVESWTPLESGALGRADQYLKDLASGRLSLNDPSVLSRVECIARTASNVPSVAVSVQLYRDTGAQNLLNAMQTWLDTVVDHPERRNVLYLVVKLANISGKLPDQLFLAPGAAQVERLPRCRGPHSLIYFGRFMEQAVVAKRIAIVEPSEIYLRLISKEALVWRQLRHPRLARFIGLESGRTHDISIVNIRYEQETISSRRELYPMLSRKRNRLLQDVAEGLEYLHINKVIHGNIKPDNILVETVDNELRAVICDFGLALVEERLDNHTICSGEYRGTPGWSDTLPPWSEEEIWIRSRPGRDIYAFGLVGLWLCTGKAMWRRDRQFLAPPPTRPSPEDCVLSPLSDELWRLLSACWVGSPDQQPTAGQLYEAFIVNADVF